MSDGESSSSHPDRTRSLRNELTAPPVPALALSPAICLDAKTKAKTRPESSATTILSDLEIFDSPTYAFTTTPTSDEPSDRKAEDDDDEPSPTRTSVSTPTTPKQYGIGRQVLSGSGSGRDFDFIGPSPKRLSASVKRDSTGLDKKESRLSFGPESVSDPNNENVEQLDKPSADEKSSEVHQDPTQTQKTRTQIPTPTPRRRVRSDDTNPSAGADVSRRSTHHEKQSHPEWTLFLGIPRNAAPPLPPPSSLLFSTREPNAIPNLASTVPSNAAPTMTQRHSLLTTNFLAPTMTIRNRTRSDSALLASASATAPGDGDGKSKVKTKRGEEDWTLSLPLVVSPTTPSSASSADVLRGSKRHSDAPSGSQPVVEEECLPRVGEVDTQDLVITVEDVDRGKQKHRQVPVRRSEEEEEDQDPLILRVPRIVRSCSSHPTLSTTSPTPNIHSQMETNWMGMGATSTPNLRRGVSSCTLKEEVMFMLLDDEAAEEDNESQSKSKSSTTSKMDLAKKKMATLDEDLARFNALLKNGNLNGTGNRPVSSIIESAVAAAATATATATPTITKTVTLNDHPEPIPSPTTPTSPSLRKKSKSSQTLPILKPALKHVKSSEPFLEKSFDGGVVHPLTSVPPSMGPVMRFPSSTGRGDMNFFDELGGHGESFKPSRASLRLTKSAEWVMGDDTLMDLGLPAPVPTMTTSASTSPRASPSPPPLSQQRTSRSNSPLTTSTTQTPLLPFAHYNTRFASSSPLSTTSNLESKGSLGRFEMRGGRGGVPTMPFRAVSMGSTSSSTAPVESNLGKFFFLY